MNKKERLVVSAYTGILMCEFHELQEYIERLLGRPVLTHEFADHSLWDAVKEKVRPEFLRLCEENVECES